MDFKILFGELIPFGLGNKLFTSFQKEQAADIQFKG